MTNAALDGVEPGLGFVRGKLDHTLGQFLRQPTLESLIRRNNTEFNGYNAACDLDTNSLRKSEGNVVRFPKVCLVTVTMKVMN